MNAFKISKALVTQLTHSAIITKLINIYVHNYFRFKDKGDLVAISYELTFFSSPTNITRLYFLSSSLHSV